LQPAQLEARQPPQPEESERVTPVADLLRAAKPEKSFSTLRDRHSGQLIDPSDAAPSISFSKVCSHREHWYSNIGTLHAPLLCAASGRTNKYTTVEPVTVTRAQDASKRTS
jgi:hypothetical protein